MKEFTFDVKARWYSGRDGFNETYVMVGDNSHLNTNLEVGKKYSAIIHDNVNGSSYSDLSRLKLLIETLSKMQIVGIDCKKFLVFVIYRDFKKLNDKINHIFDFFNILNNYSNILEQQISSDLKAS